MHPYKNRPAGSTATLARASRQFSRPQQKAAKAGLPESMGGWLTLLAKLALLYGGTWLFVYCYFAIGFFPSGISAADSIFLLFVAASFGFVVLLVAGFGLILVNPLFWFLDVVVGVRGKKAKPVPVAGAVSGLALIGLVITLTLVATLDVRGQQFEWAALIGGLAGCYGVLAYSFKRASDPTSDATDAFGAGALAFLATLLLLMLVASMQWWALPFAFVQGLLAVMLLVAWRSPSTAKKRTLGIWLLAALNLFAPIYMALLFPGERAMNPVLSLTFERLGLYHETSDVLLSNKAAQQMWRLATEQELGLQGCLLDDGALLLSRTQVLWHGVGTRTLLKVPDLGLPANLAQGRIELDASDVRLLSPLPHQCAQLPTEVHFASKSVDPIDAREVEALKRDFGQALERAPKGWLLAEVQLRGHADPMPLSKDGNLELGVARAKAVAAELVKQYDLAGSVRRGLVNIDVESNASRTGRAVSCPFTGEHESLAECHARDRRVEVRLIFRPLEAQG